jgi:hypothetical protein
VTFGDAAGKNIPFSSASSSGPASLEFAEDTDNGSNKVTVVAPAALAADRVATLPDKTGTIAMISDVPAAASASEQEAATDAEKYVTPATQHRHPSAAKAWLHSKLSAGAPQVSAAYNVTSITDDGAGLYRINLTTAFSSTAWAALLSCQGNGATDGLSAIRNGAATYYTASVLGVVCFTGTSSAAADPESFTFAGYGDQ